MTVLRYSWHQLCAQYIKRCWFKLLNKCHFLKFTFKTRGTNVSFYQLCVQPMKMCNHVESSYFFFIQFSKQMEFLKNMTWKNAFVLANKKKRYAHFTKFHILYIVHATVKRNNLVAIIFLKVQLLNKLVYF